LPIVSLLIATAIAVVPFLLMHDEGQSSARYEAAREEARSFLVRNPELRVDTAGRLILDPEWLAKMRTTLAEARENSVTKIDLPARMLARSQARLDDHITVAYEIRKNSDPAWRYGVLGSQTATQNYLIHAFVQPSKSTIVLTIAVLLLAGIALEMTWGSLIFATFVMAAIPLTAQGYRILDASSGVPWSGAAGLAGAILGAYFIRGLGGHFTIPGWILLPLWLGVEALVVRGFWIDHLGSVPWATICASVAIGALTAGGLRLTNFDARVVPRRANQGPNPIVARAARLRSDGDPYQAFDLIQAAWRDDSSCPEIAEAFFSIAVEVDQPEAAAEAIVPSLHQALRRGEVARAIDYWFPLAARECDVRLDPTAAVKLGEVLLDAGHPKEAIFTFRMAIDVGVSVVHATRIVRIARDLDESLARRAASIAMADPGLDAKLRAEFEPIVASSDDSSYEMEEEPPELEAESQCQLDRRISAEHQAVETTVFPVGGDEDFTRIGSGEPEQMDSNESRLATQALDAGALSKESLSSTSDVLSHWSDPNSLSKTAELTNIAEEASTPDLASTVVLGDSSGLPDQLPDEDLLDASALESREIGFDFGTTASGSDFFNPLEDETDTDSTPLIDVGTDATDEKTSPLVPDETVALIQSPPADSTTAVFDQPTMLFDAPVVDSTPPPQDSAGSAISIELRSLRALEAVPISMGADWIEIDASPKGKSKLPFARIETLSMAAVDGLGPKPILVVDCILSESKVVGDQSRVGQSGETDVVMKSIRFRSDRFDPRPFVPDAPNSLAALTAWVNRLQSSSNANCLPSREILNGSFRRFVSMEAYEHEVLGVVREDES
jgi:hypothetical protein